jgi:hypothetical protein
VLTKINKNISLQQVRPLSEAEIQGLHPDQVNLEYFLAGFQSLQLPSTQSESPLALIPRAPKSHLSFQIRRMYATVNRIFHISVRIIPHPD